MNLTRRTFIKHSALGVTGIAMPTVLSPSVLGKEGRTSPNNRINMAFIGLGSQGSGHLFGGNWTYVSGGFLAQSEVQVRAVCDVWKGRRESAAKRCNEFYGEGLGQAGYDDVVAYRDFRAILDRSDIDAVLLALPFHWHAMMAVMAMKSGKDVYCEKPIALTIEEAEAVERTAKQYGRIYQAGTQQISEYGGVFRQACDLAKGGAIGELKEVYAYRKPGAFFPKKWTSNRKADTPEDLDWDLWLGPLPWRAYDSRSKYTPKDLIAGDVNWGPHHYDIVNWALGLKGSELVEIEYDRGNVHYHVPNGPIVHSYGFPGENTGSQGGVCLVGSKGRVAVDRDGITTYPERLLRAPLPDRSNRLPVVTSHARNFLDSIRARRPAIGNESVSASSAKLLIAGGLALGLNRSLSWQVGDGSFPDDKEANLYRSYQARPPWKL